ncbi:MAG: flagellar basal body-associated FliL family protein [Desulfovibrio sp.]|nr:flagellar basal body-associated FliL family protein [Desulfovibrio sp.]
MADEQMVKDPPEKEEVSVASGGQDSVRKVELDLDDAPFLKEEAPQPPAEATKESTAESPTPPEAPADTGKKKKKKLLLFVAVGVTVLLAAAAAAWWFLLRTPGPPPPPPVEPVKPEVIVVPSTPSEPAAKAESLKELAAFIIPRQTPQGTRFLICKFSTLSTDPNVDTEIDNKLLPLRDALYYYLNSKSDEFLLNAANAAKVKQDLAGVLNDYITQGKIEDILFESYLNE